MSSWVERREELQAIARETDKACRLVCFPFALGVAFTFGALILIPKTWTYDMAFWVVPHEARHVRQYRWFGLGIHPWVGLIPFLLTYFLLPIPLLLAWPRYRLELDACFHSWVARAAYRENPATPSQLQQIALSSAARVSGGSYLYSVPAPWARWGYTRKVDEAYRIGRVRLLASYRGTPRGY